MCRYREQFGFARVHVRRERHERVTQLRDRFLVFRQNGAYAKAECNDENNRSNHVGKIGEELSVNYTKITDVFDDTSLMLGENLREPPHLVKRVVERGGGHPDNVWFPEIALHSSGDKLVMQLLWMLVRQNG